MREANLPLESQVKNEPWLFNCVIVRYMRSKGKLCAGSWEMVLSKAAGPKASP